MSLLYVLGFGLPWVLVFALIVKFIVKRIIYLTARERFLSSWEAAEVHREHYQKKYRDVEMGEYDG